MNHIPYLKTLISQQEDLRIKRYHLDEQIKILQTQLNDLKTKDRELDQLVWKEDLKNPLCPVCGSHTQFRQYETQAVFMCACGEYVEYKEGC